MIKFILFLIVAVFIVILLIKYNRKKRNKKINNDTNIYTNNNVHIIGRQIKYQQNKQEAKLPLEQLRVVFKKYDDLSTRCFNIGISYKDGNVYVIEEDISKHGSSLIVEFTKKENGVDYDWFSENFPLEHTKSLGEYINQINKTVKLFITYNAGFKNGGYIYFLNKEDTEQCHSYVKRIPSNLLDFCTAQEFKVYINKEFNIELSDNYLYLFKERDYKSFTNKCKNCFYIGSIFNSAFEQVVLKNDRLYLLECHSRPAGPSFACYPEIGLKDEPKEITSFEELKELLEKSQQKEKFSDLNKDNWQSYFNDKTIQGY